MPDTHRCSSSPNVFVGGSIPMNKKFLYFLVILFSFSGCTIINNLDELKTLGAYSREKDAQHRDVKDIDGRYDGLTKVIDKGFIEDYKDKSSFVHSFGQPILKKSFADGQERWLYRHAIYRLSKDKVYVYFDSNGKLVKWERLPCPKLF